jgi:hypothetical protein
MTQEVSSEFSSLVAGVPSVSHVGVWHPTQEISQEME